MRSFGTLSVLLAQLFTVLPFAAAIDVNPTDPGSLKAAAATAAASAVNYYNNRESKLIPGKFDGTWWEGGAFFTFLINYWHWTGDDQYNALVTEGLSWQGGEHNDFFPSNYSSYLVSILFLFSFQFYLRFSLVVLFRLILEYRVPDNIAWHNLF